MNSAPIGRVSLLAILVSPLLMATPIEYEYNSWVDQQHQIFSRHLDRWANNINDWLGETDPSKPADATLRLMLDNEWNRYDGYNFKPRVRGKIKLPVLKKRLSLVFGDDSLDDEKHERNRIGQNYAEPLDKKKRYDARQSRDSNASFALRWSRGAKSLGINTDLDLGIRATTDVYLRAKIGKLWEFTDRLHLGTEQIYRYGVQSHHYARSNIEWRYFHREKQMIANFSYVEYRYKHKGDTTWGNSFFHQHNFNNFKQLNYGIFIGGSFDRQKNRINQYGPFINWRQPVLRKWLFVQPELNFYNNRDTKRKHHLGAFLRVEAVF